MLALRIVQVGGDATSRGKAMAKILSFVEAMRDYFGLKEGQTLSDFYQELKALSTEDRAWFRQELPKVGYEIKVTI